MQPMAHDPGAAAIGAHVAANGSRGLATGTTVGAATTALLPAGADEVSAWAATAFAAEGVAMLGINTLAQQELCRAGALYVEIAALYTAVDEAGAAGLS